MALHPKMAGRVKMIVYCAALIYGAALVAVGANDYLPNEYDTYVRPEQGAYKCSSFKLCHAYLKLKYFNKIEESFCKLCLVNIIVEVYSDAYRTVGWKRGFMSW